MALSEAARKARNEYQRNYMKRHPDKRRKYLVDYWERKAAAVTPEMKAKALHDAGYTQREIAEALEISLGTVNNYLNKE